MADDCFSLRLARCTAALVLDVGGAAGDRHDVCALRGPCESQVQPDEPWHDSLLKLSAAILEYRGWPPRGVADVLSRLAEPGNTASLPEELVDITPVVVPVRAKSYYRTLATK